MSKTPSENIKKVPVSMLNPAPYNPRVELKPTDPEYQHIKNSLDSFGYLDPIVWNERTGNIVSGHQRFKILTDEGATELLVRVVDFDEDTEKACNLAMNKAVGLWDDAKLNALLEEMKATSWNMEDFGFEGFEEGELEEEPDNPYTQKIISPTYTPNGEHYDPDELYDKTKADQLIAEIEGADLPEDIQKFLTFSAYRHIVFDYQKIAEYYASAPKKVQELMEQSALVIIDINKAIENGFAVLREDLLNIAEASSDNTPKAKDNTLPTVHIVVGGSCAGKSSFVRNTFIRGRAYKTEKDLIPLTELPDCYILGRYDTGERRVGTDKVSRQQISDFLPQIKKLLPKGKDIVLEGVKCVSNPLFSGIEALGCPVKLYWIRISASESIRRVKANGGIATDTTLKTECTKAKNIYNKWCNVFDSEILDTTSVSDFSRFSAQDHAGATSTRGNNG